MPVRREGVRKVAKRRRVLKALQKILGEYPLKFIGIGDYHVPLYLPPLWSDEDLNLFDGITVLIEPTPKELRRIQRYRPPVSGYCLRLLIVLNDVLMIKDFRVRRSLRLKLADVSEGFLSVVQSVLKDPSEENLCKLFGGDYNEGTT